MSNRETPFARPQGVVLTRRLAEPRRFIQAVAGPRQVGMTTLVQPVTEAVGLPTRFASADEPGCGEPDGSIIMHALIEKQRPAITELCQRHRVRRLEVFGSGARGGDFDPQRSDVDFLVEFDGAGGAPTLKTFFAFRDELAAVLGRPVDLVMAGSLTNPFVKVAVDRSRELVYAP
jgi:predicted nucleotidyltransferase